MPPTFNTISSVSGSTTLTAALYNNTIGENGSLAYLYYALNPFYGDCATQDQPIALDVEWSRSLTVQAIPNATWTTIVWDAYVYGDSFFDPFISAFSPEYSNCNGVINANMNLMISLNTTWAAQATGIGMRAGRFSFLSNTDCTPILQTSSTISQKPTSNPQNANYTVNFTFIMPILVTGTTPTFTFSIDTYQNSGGASNMNSADLTIYKLPMS
jgi:hypothetical protein